MPDARRCVGAEPTGSAARDLGVTQSAGVRSRHRSPSLRSEPASTPRRPGTTMATITISLPDGSPARARRGCHRDRPGRVDRLRLAKAAVAAVVDGEECDLGRRAARRRRVSIITERHRGGSPRAAPLDGARDGAGRHAAVPGRQVLDRSGHRERLLLRLRPARRRDVQRRRPRARSRRGCARSSRPTSRSCAPSVDAARRWSCSPTSRTRCEIIERCRRRRGATSEDAGEIGGGDTISVYRNTDEFVDLCAARTCRRRAGSATSS